LILSFGNLTEETGSYLTANIARQVGKPCLHIRLPRFLEIERRGAQFQIGAGRIMDFLRHHQIATLNVAGPRESREPGIQAAVRAALVEILGDELGFGGR
jgi:hypothetical protein